MKEFRCRSARRSPGAQMHISPVKWISNTRRRSDAARANSYATLINDCIRGDATLFDRADSVEAAWALVDPITEAWVSGTPPPFPNYPAGSAGPTAANDLTLADGRRWRPL